MNGGSFRQSMSWLHTWGGLVFGWIGFAIFFTGTLAVFDEEISLWLNPGIEASAAADTRHAVAQMAAADARSPQYWFAMLPTARNPSMRLVWRDGGKMVDRTVDAASGRPVLTVPSSGGQFFTKFHYTLHAGDIGLWIVAATSVAMLCFIVSGIIIHRRIFKDFFVFRPRAAAQRRLMDLHNVTAVLTLPFLLMIVYTGLTIKSPDYLPASTALDSRATIPRVTQDRPEPSLAGAPAVSVARLLEIAEARLGRDRIAFVTVTGDDSGAIRLIASRRFDDRLNLSTDTVTLDRRTGALLDMRSVTSDAYLTQRVLAGLHFGQYSGRLVQWIYWALGLAGTVMIGAGLLLFSAKRAGQDARWGLRAAHRMSIAVITGLCLATLAYLWAARFLPVRMTDRPALEFALFLGAWALAAVHAFARPRDRLWREQLAACAMLAFGLLLLDPLDAVSRFGLEALFGRTVRLMFDIVMLGSALAFLRLAVGRRSPRSIVAE